MRSSAALEKCFFSWSPKLKQATSPKIQTTLQSNTTETKLNWEQPIAKRMAERLPQDYQNWKLAAPVPNKAGGKSAGIVDQSGSPITLYTAPLRVPFDALG